MALQPSAGEVVDRTRQAPFLLRLFWRHDRPLEPYEFSLAPTQDARDYYSLLPYNIRSQSVEIYTWPSCTIRELTGLLLSVIDAAPGTRLVYKLIFPDTRAQIEGGRGKWIDRPLGAATVGEEGDDKTLAEARFVIGDYVACTIVHPGAPQGDWRRRY